MYINIDQKLLWPGVKMNPDSWKYDQIFQICRLNVDWQAASDDYDRGAINFLWRSERALRRWISMLQIR